jgi:hypothetical protein
MVTNSKVIENWWNRKSRSKKLRNYNNIQGYIWWIEYDAIDDYLNGSHFTVIPSKHDAFNVVGIESMMNQTPL